MQLHLETLEIIRKPICSSKHRICCMKLDSHWKSSLKIMFNDIFGINNLRSHKSSSSSHLQRCSWTSIWIYVMICFLLLALDVDARPTAGISRPVRDYSRHFRTSSSSTGYSSSLRSFNISSSSSDSLSSLSVFSPLDILRQNMLLEIQRKRMRHAKQRQVQSNKEYLDRIGR